MPPQINLISIFNSTELYSKSANQLQEHPDGPSGVLSLVSILEVECSRSHREHRRTLV